MALNYHELQAIFEKIGSVTSRPVSVLSLGYPDLFIKPEEVQKLLGKKCHLSLPIREDSTSIIQEHNQGDHFESLFETNALFEAMGAELTTFDISKHRGSETIVDLNMPVSQRWHGVFDLVIDPGTLEHCFNIAQAILNIASFLKRGGWVFHQNPYSLANHGFYSISPEFYFSFYLSNGFDIESFQVEGWDRHPLELRTIEPQNTCHRVWATKQEEMSLKIPIQGVYDDSRITPAAIFDYIRTAGIKRVALWPASTFSRNLIKAGIYDVVDSVLLVDSNKTGEVLEDHVIDDPAEIIQFDPDLLIVTSYIFGEAIKRAAIDMGFPEAKIKICF